MNQLIVMQSLTMSSREIADLTSKRHDNVLQLVRKLEADGILTPEFQETNHNGRMIPFATLGKRDSMVLVARLSPEFTAAIVDRWQELESQQSPKLPQTKLEWIEFALEQERKLELAAPKVAFVDNCVERSTLLTAGQVGQKHKMSAVRINRILDEVGGVYNKTIKRGRVFCQPFIDKGYGELKQTEMGHSQALFTTLGEQWINEKLISEGFI